ncbi:MAG: TraR/DksA family transcriptional regulator [Bacteriovoracaceae bacterium]|nr:TraR/DksA family transcriptional regulator [Bacteriovoracaceae bacterium]
MDTEVVTNLKRKLLVLKAQILNGGLLAKTTELQTPTEDLADDADLASSAISQEVSFNIREKELGKLREIELALQRIEDKTYGHCADCSEEISSKRLEKQPWTNLCIVHAEERERETLQFARRA